MASGSSSKGYNLFSIIVLALSILFINNITIISAATPACGSTITTSTTLDTNMSCSGTAITIGAGSIVFDCAGFAINGNGSGYGVNNTGFDDTTIKNCRIQNFTSGISLQDSSNALVFNNSIYNLVGTTGVTGNPGGPGGIGAAIYLSSSNNSNLSSNTITNITGGPGGGGGGGGTGGPGGIGAAIYISSSTNNSLSLNAITNITGGLGGASNSNSFVGGLGGIGAAIYLSSSTNNSLSLNAITNITGGQGGLGLSNSRGGASGIGAGIYLSSSTNNSLLSNTITNFTGAQGGQGGFKSAGTAGGISAAIYLSSSTNNSLSSNTIINIKGGQGTSGGSDAPGGAGGISAAIYISSSTNNSLSLNAITNITGGLGGIGGARESGGTGGISAAIYLSSSNNSNLSANTLTNITGGQGGTGTSSGSGATGGISAAIYLSSSINNSFSLNTITNITGGLGGTAEGIYPGSVGASQQGYGIFIDSGSFNNEISETNIVGGNPVFYFYSKTGISVQHKILTANSNPTNLGKIVLINSSGTIYNNTIANFRGVSGGSGGEMGSGGTGDIGAAIYLSSSNNSNLSLNAITNIIGGQGGTGGYGGSGGLGSIGAAIYLSSSNNSNFSDNTVTNITGGQGGTGGYPSRPQGAAGVSVAIYLSSSSDNSLLSNNISTVSYGVYLQQGNNNNFTNNRIATNKTNSSGVFLDISSSNNFIGNTIMNSTVGVYINASSNNNNFISNTITNGSSYLFMGGAGTGNSMTNTTFSASNDIRYPQQFPIPTNTNVTSTKLNLTTLNRIYLNSSNLTFLNTSAVVTMKGLPLAASGATPTVAFDDINFQACTSPQCTGVNYAGGVLTFNVSSFTTYSSTNISVTACTNLSVPGVTYVLANDITATGTCITIAANNVTLDCQGRTIRYGTTSNIYVKSFGVNVTNVYGFTLKNCNIIGQRTGGGSPSYYDAVYIEGGANHKILNNSINLPSGALMFNYAKGIDIYWTAGVSPSNNVTISNNNITVNVYGGGGIYVSGGMSGSSGHYITDNTITMPGEGGAPARALETYNSAPITISRNNIVYKNGDNAVILTGSSSVSSPFNFSDNNITLFGTAEHGSGIAFRVSNLLAPYAGVGPVVISGNKFTAVNVSSASDSYATAARIEFWAEVYPSTVQAPIIANNIFTAISPSGGVSRAAYISSYRLMPLIFINNVFNVSGVSDKYLSLIKSGAVGGATVNITNTTFTSPYGSIRYPQKISDVNTTGSFIPASTLRITNNLVFLNTSQIASFPWLNSSAELTLTGLTTPVALPTVAFDDANFQVCSSPQCTNVNYNAGTGTLAFNVAGFTTYSSVGDVTPPVSDISLSGTAGANSWYISDVQVTLSATDDSSGMKETRYSTDNFVTTNSTYTSPFAVSAEGTTTVYYYSVDNANNAEAIKIKLVNIDKTPPSAPVATDPGMYDNNGAITVTWDASTDANPGSGVDKYKVYRCSVETPDTCTPTYRSDSQTTGYPDSGLADATKYIYKISAVDLAGLEGEQSNAVDIIIDKTPPLPPVLDAISPNGFINVLSVLLSWSASTDPGILASGLKDYTLFKDLVQYVTGIITTTYTDTSVSNGNTYTYEVNAIDNANNLGDKSNAQLVTVDLTAPVSTATVIAGVLGDNGWYVSDAAVQILATDAVSGVMKREYSLGASFVEYTSPVTISADGTTTVTYKSTDNANNAETAKTLSVKVDKIAPTTTDDIPATPQRSVTVTLSASDATPGSGVAATYYRINGGAYVQYTSPFTISTAGTSSVEYYSVDNAGNTEIANANSVVIDLTPPDVVITSPAKDDVILTSPVTVSVQASDANGVTSVSVNGVAAALVSGDALSGTWNASVPVTLPVQLGGALSFTATATDTPGNSGDSVALIVDNDGITSDIDRNKVTGADQSLVYSNDFKDNDGTYGTITSRGGWNVQMIDVPPFMGTPYGVRVGVAGSGTTLTVVSCNNNVETQLNVNGETAEITCGSTKVLAVQAIPSIIMREPPSGTTGKATKVTLKTGQKATLGSYVTADQENTEAIDASIVDENDMFLCSVAIHPSITVDVQLPETGEVIISNSVPTQPPVIFTMADGTNLTLPAEATVSLGIVQEPSTGTVTGVTYSNEGTVPVTVESNETTVTLPQDAAVNVSINSDGQTTIDNVGEEPITIEVDGTIYHVSAGQTYTENCEVPGIKPPQCDVTPPVTTALLSGATGANSWYTSDVSVSLAAADEEYGSGINRTYFCVDQDNTCVPAEGASAIISSEGTNYVRYYSTDNNGNIETMNSDIAKIDKTAPIVAIDPLPQYDSDGSYTVSWSASDNIADTLIFNVYRDGQPYATTSDNSITEEGIADGVQHSYYVEAVDWAGLKAVSASTSTATDISAPTVPVMSSLPAYTTAMLVQLGWTSSEDPSSGVSHYNLYRNGDVIAVPVFYITSYTDSAVAEGQNYIYAASATDFTGHESAKSDAVSTTIDTAAPSSSLTVDGVIGSNDWYKQSDVGVTISSSDATSGVSIIRYRINGGAWQQYTGAFQLSDGQWIVEYYAVDAAGNSESSNSATINVDTVPPVTTDDIPSVWMTEDTLVNISASDATSGIAATYVCSDSSNSCQPAIGPLSFVLPEAINYVRYYSVDSAGNIEQLHVTVGRVDKTAPVTTANISGAKEDEPYSDWLKDSATVTLTGRNGISHVYQTLYCIDQSNTCIPSVVGFQCPERNETVCPTVATVQIPITTQGVNYIRFQSVKVAGKVEAVKSVAVNIDKDRDSDTVYDNFDACRTLAGRPAYSGCPVGENSEVTMSILDQDKTGECGCRQTVTVKTSDFRYSSGCNAAKIVSPKKNSGETAYIECSDANDLTTVTIHSSALSNAGAVSVNRLKVNGRDLTNFVYNGTDASGNYLWQTSVPKLKSSDKLQAYLSLHKAVTGTCKIDKTCTEAVDAADVKVFNRTDQAFIAAWTSSPKETNYPAIFESSAGLVASCTTDETGTCIAGEPSAGKYLAITKFKDDFTNKTAYIGRNKEPDDFKDTNKDGIGDFADKDFQVTKVISKGVVSYKPSSKLTIVGSMLEIIRPDYTIWEEKTELYPFLFTSDSNWTVDLCMYVPTGYKILEGNCTQVFVENETKDALFTVVETGSPEPDVSFKLSAMSPHGEATDLNIAVPGQRIRPVDVSVYVPYAVAIAAVVVAAYLISQRIRGGKEKE